MSPENVYKVFSDGGGGFEVRNVYIHFCYFFRSRTNISFEVEDKPSTPPPPGNSLGPGAVFSN